MSVLKWFISGGIKPHHQPWEKDLIERLNTQFAFSYGNFLSGLIIMSYFNFDVFFWEQLIWFVLILLNKVVLHTGRYMIALYWYMVGGLIFVSHQSYLAGWNSFFFMYFFLFLFLLLVVLHASPIFKHFKILVGLLFLTYIAQFFIIPMEGYTENLTVEQTHLVGIFNQVAALFASSYLSVRLVTSIRESQTQLKAVLKNREVLLAEVNHRVKNNMNIILSLLNLQKRVSNNQVVEEALEECRQRVYSMALVHQQLLAGPENSLSFKQYAEKFMHQLCFAQGQLKPTQLHLQIDEFDLDANSAIPLGLILNELITNSIKHGKENLEELELSVEISRIENGIKLHYADNGVGFDLNKNYDSFGLGLALIDSLSDQLNGTKRFDTSNGTHFYLDCPLKT